MSLWQQFKIFCANDLTISPTNRFESVYDISTKRVRLVLYFRVLCASWVEDNIGNISSTNFVRALYFHAKTSLHNPSTSLPTHLGATMLSELEQCLAKPSQCSAFYQEMFNYVQNEHRLLENNSLLEEVLAQKLAMFSSSNKADVDSSAAFPEPLQYNDFRIFQVGAQILHMYNELLNRYFRFQQVVQELLNGQHAIQVDLRTAEEAVNLAHEISEWKLELERNLDDVTKEANRAVDSLKTWKWAYERSQVFSNRDRDKEKIDHITWVYEFVEKLLGAIDRLISSVNKLETINFIDEVWTNRNAILLQNPCLPSNGFDPADQQPYQNNFTYFSTKLKELLWEPYHVLMIIVRGQLPLVSMQGSWRHISFTVMNFWNILSGPFTLKMCLVNEATVSKLRKSEILPDCSSLETAGLLEVTEVAASNETSKKKTRTGCKRKVAAKNKNVGTWVSLEETAGPYEKFHHVSKNIKVTAREKKVKQRTQLVPKRRVSRGQKSRSCKNPITDNKVALLLVLHVSYYGEQKTIWTVTLPTSIASNSSQNDQAWLTMVWDDAFALPPPERYGFEVKELVDANQILQLLRNAFEAIVQTKMEVSHEIFLKLKIMQLRSGNPNLISKAELLDGLWDWFYKSALIIAPNSHFNDVWKEGHIEGFIDDKCCTRLLQSQQIEPGTFIVRFSESFHGGLTFVFKSSKDYSYSIFKMTPIEVYKQKGKDERSETLQTKLQLRDWTRTEIFSNVYPNSKKQDVFKKFYKRTLTTVEYVKVDSVARLDISPRCLEADTDNQETLVLSNDDRKLLSALESDAILNIVEAIRNVRIE